MKIENNLQTPEKSFQSAGKPYELLANIPLIEEDVSLLGKGTSFERKRTGYDITANHK